MTQPSWLINKTPAVLHQPEQSLQMQWERAKPKLKSNHIDAMMAIFAAALNPHFNPLEIHQLHVENRWHIFDGRFGAKYLFNSNVDANRNDILWFLKELRALKTALHDSQKSRLITKSALQDDLIRQHNGRPVDSATVERRLENAFKTAQIYLDTGGCEKLCSAEIDAYIKQILVDFRGFFSAEADPLNSPHTTKLAGSCSTIGRREAMEDGKVIETISLETPNGPVQVPFIGVFDGHINSSCMSFLCENTPKHFKRELQKVFASEDKQTSIFNILKLWSVKMTRQYPLMVPKEEAIAGSAGIVALIDPTERALWVANCGDCRAILVEIKDQQGEGENAFDVTALSTDAKPFNQRGEEGSAFEDSVNRRGSQICSLWGGGLAPCERVIKPSATGDISNQKMLNMTYAVGHDEVETGINPRSKVVKYPLDNLKGSENFLVMASDGFFDVLSSKQAGELVAFWHAKNMAAPFIAQYLTTAAYALGSSDNITVVVVPLRR